MELKGKVISFLGDSITEGHGVTDPSKRFDNRLKELAGLKAAYNYGIGGTRIAHQRHASEMPRFDLSFCGRCFDLHPDSDVIVVFGGTNDYGHGDAPFGEEADHTPDTFTGGVHFLMDALKETYPGATIVFMTPARRWGDELPSQDNQQAVAHRPLADYVDVILEAAAGRDIPVLDLYHDMPVNPNISEDREVWTTDGLHLNDAGHALVADLLKGFLEKL